MHCQRNAAKIAPTPRAMSTMLRLLYIVPISFSLLLLHIESSAVVHAFPSSSSAAAIMAQRQQNRHNSFNLMRQASVAPLAALVLQDEGAAETVPLMLVQVGENEQPADAGNEAEQQQVVDDDDDDEEEEEEQELVEEKRKSSRGQDAEAAETSPQALARSHAELFTRMRSICGRMNRLKRKRTPRPGSPESLVAYLCNSAKFS
uniref:BHLH domain-containing protein n=1 Tax=Globodera pallida TaxID=36090 RepID=A0A183C031_GLOPA